MGSFYKVLKDNIKQQIAADAVARPRLRASTIRIASHDRELELVVGGQTGDISYSIIETTLDYDPAVE